MLLLYIDPGSGSLFFQALLSGFLTLVLFYKKVIAYIKYLFNRGKSQNESSDDDE